MPVGLFGSQTQTSRARVAWAASAIASRSIDSSRAGTTVIAAPKAEQTWRYRPYVSAGTTTGVPGSTKAAAIEPISACAPCAGMMRDGVTPSDSATATRKSANARSG